MTRLFDIVRVGTSQACVLHGHPKKAGSKTDKPAGTPIKCYPFSGEGGRAGAIKKAYSQHYAITKNEGMARLQEVIELPIEVGDTILTGKFKNHRVEVKEIGVDDIGHPTINGRPILKIRIAKLLDEEAGVQDILSRNINKFPDWDSANDFSLSRRFPMVVIKGDGGEFWVVRKDDGERLVQAGYEYAR